MRDFYVVKNPLIKPSLSINERFSTIEGSTIEGFQCIRLSRCAAGKNYLVGWLVGTAQPGF